LAWFLVICGGVLLFIVPIGTVIGAYFLIFSLTRRRQFLNGAKAIAST
jgi:hypothetical protein